MKVKDTIILNGVLYRRNLVYPYAIILQYMYRNAYNKTTYPWGAVWHSCIYRRDLVYPYAIILSLEKICHSLLWVLSRVNNVYKGRRVSYSHIPM